MINKINNPRIIKQLKQINSLMDLRISQLKQVYEEHWWEESLKDEMYIFLCKEYTEIKIMETKPVAVLNKEEMDNLLSGLTQLSDFKLFGGETQVTKLTKQEALKELDQINERAEALRKYIEQVESKKPRKPEIGQDYWYVDETGARYHYYSWGNDKIDNARLRIGNVFLTKEEIDNCLLRLESMANRGEMPEEDEEFWCWDFKDSCPRRWSWYKAWFPYWFIGNVHKTEEECRAWYEKYGKAFEALMGGEQ